MSSMLVIMSHMLPCLLIYGPGGRLPYKKDGCVDRKF